MILNGTFSQFQDFHARLNHDLVEMNPSQSLLCQKPAVRITSFNCSQVKLRPKTTPVLPRRRPVSSGNVEQMSSKLLENSKNHASDDESSSSGILAKSVKNSEGEGKNHLTLFMYVIGGRVGQVTVFNGPISLWKLDLTKTF